MNAIEKMTAMMQKYPNRLRTIAAELTDEERQYLVDHIDECPDKLQAYLRDVKRIGSWT
uniref:Uncharacterized protein n=1 Tax=viral metagenome TaxID=1070528 RepID=A0A6M3J467_9ZZZZ